MKSSSRTLEIMINSVNRKPLGFFIKILNVVVGKLRNTLDTEYLEREISRCESSKAHTNYSLIDKLDLFGLSD